MLTIPSQSGCYRRRHDEQNEAAGAFIPDQIQKTDF
jgi:hypothetical protein